MRIGEHYCRYYGGCDYRNYDCFGRISHLIEAFSQFDTVELSPIIHVSYMGTRSVLNSNRLCVSVGFNYDINPNPNFMSECRKWLNYKAPNYSQPPRELYFVEKLGFHDVRALLEGLISVCFSSNYHAWFLFIIW